MTIHFAPNKPVYLKIADPEGQYDFELQAGQYQTTEGDQFQLPRSAVVFLNGLGARPGEELQITKHWSGRSGESSQWTVALSTRSEQDRAEAGDPGTLTDKLERSIEQVKRAKPVHPVEIPKKAVQPAPSPARLFDRGDGTYGPDPQPAPVPAATRQQRPGVIPANVAVREILAFIAEDPNTKNWADQARQGTLGSRKGNARSSKTAESGTR